MNERLKVKDDTRSGYIDELTAEITRLKAQNAKLVEALKLCISDDLRQSKHERNILPSRIKQARAALAKVKKENTP